MMNPFHFFVLSTNCCLTASINTNKWYANRFNRSLTLCRNETYLLKKTTGYAYSVFKMSHFLKLFETCKFIHHQSKFTSKWNIFTEKNKVLPLLFSWKWATLKLFETCKSIQPQSNFVSKWCPYFFLRKKLFSKLFWNLQINSAAV